MKKNLFKSMFLTRIVISYSIVIMLIASLFTFELYRISEEKKQNAVVQYQKELATKTASQLDSFLREMDNIAYRVMSDTNIVICFTKLNNDHDMSNYFKHNIMDSINIVSVLKTINSSSNPMWRITVYEQYGDFISSGTITADYDGIEERLESMNVAETMLKLQNSNRTVLSPQEDRWSDYFGSKYISILRPVMNQYSKNVYAVVEVQQDVSNLDRLLESGLDNTKLCIYDEKDNLIYSHGQIHVGGNLLKNSAVSEISGWKVEITTVDPSKYGGAFVGFVFIYLICIIFILLITYIIANRITRPLQNLRLSVSKVSPTNISIETNDDVIDEIKELGDAFSAVLMRMGNAVEQEKKAYSLALQSQMNPHFLFNILSVISGAGMEAGSDKIVDMCQHVSDMLRYVSSYESALVPFSDEIAHTKNYLELMKARYEDYLYWDIFVDDKINKVMVPKLILQPLVENCFKDAFFNVEPPWKIHIELGIEEGYWYMKVQDNGIGVSKNQIEAIDKRIKKYSQNIEGSYRELKIGGLGLVSTISRLKLSCDEDVQYIIEAKTKGTSVTIKVKL